MVNNLDSLIELINKSNSTLFIMCGLPYSGKTYLAKNIIKKASLDYISVDSIPDALGYDWNISKLPNKAGWEEIMNKSYDMVRSGLVKQNNVLYDSTNHTLESRSILRKIASELGCEAVILFVYTPEEIIRQRWSTNKLNPKRFVLDESLLDKTIHDFETPDKDENTLVFNLI